jgi:4'-phosphopantetheinyl transferase
MKAIWAPGPAVPELQDGAIHVWRADLATLEEEHRALLDAEESARAKRFVQEQDGRRWAQSHRVLRALLGSYLGLDGSALRFAAGEHGKPALDFSTDDSAHPRLSFNLSHSGDLALYAIAATTPVGIDVETPRSVERLLEIALRTFGPAESAQLEQLSDPEARRHEFLRMWTRHEAKLKCLGTGIGGAPLAAGAPRPWTRDLAMGNGAVAAVAVAHAPSELCCWRWPPAT